MGNIVVATVMAAAAFAVGASLPQEQVTVAGCYVFDAGSPGEPLPVLVSDTTHDGLCQEEGQS